MCPIGGGNAAVFSHATIHAPAGKFLSLKEISGISSWGGRWKFENRTGNRIRVLMLSGFPPMESFNIFMPE